MTVVEWIKEHITLTRTPEKEREPKTTVVGTPSRGNDDVRKRFLSQPDNPREKRTTFQERMQSGGI